MNRLKELRKSKKLTQEQLGKEIGVSKITILRWENQERDIKSDKADILANYFNVNVGYLLGFTDSPTGNDKPLSFNTPEEFEKTKKRIAEGNGETLGIAYKADGTSFITDFSKIVELKYDAEDLGKTGKKLVELFDSLGTEYKHMLYINTVDSLNQEQKDKLKKVSEAISEIEEQDKYQREMWIEELKEKQNNNK